MSLNHIIKPVITEKSMRLAQKGQYTFLVALNTTKGAVKQAIEDLFKVTVTQVRINKTAGKTRRSGKKKLLTKQADKKKAIVTLKSGESIKYFETKKK
jgi:large subunit ribosomal protein L23